MVISVNRIHNNTLLNMTADGTLSPAEGIYSTYHYILYNDCIVGKYMTFKGALDVIYIVNMFLLKPMGECAKEIMTLLNEVHSPYIRLKVSTTETGESFKAFQRFCYWG